MIVDRPQFYEVVNNKLQPSDPGRFAFTGPDSKQMQRGMSLGYVKLSNGYISVNGICPEGNQLGSTVVGMQKVSLVR